MRKDSKTIAMMRRTRSQEPSRRRAAASSSAYGSVAQSAAMVEPEDLSMIGSTDSFVYVTSDLPFVFVMCKALSLSCTITVFTRGLIAAEVLNFSTVSCCRGHQQSQMKSQTTLSIAAQHTLYRSRSNTAWRLYCMSSRQAVQHWQTQHRSGLDVNIHTERSQSNL